MARTLCSGSGIRFLINRYGCHWFFLGISICILFAPGHRKMSTEKDFLNGDCTASVAHFLLMKCWGPRNHVRN